MSKKQRKPQRKQSKPKQGGQWRTIFDAKPMADGMPPMFLLKLLEKQPFFVRHSKLLTASLWLQSQMVGAICLQEDPALREMCLIENGRHMPAELGRATIQKLERLSSESLRKEFHECFHTLMSEQLQNDLETVVIFRDALAHGYISHMQHIAGEQKDHLFWSPRSSSSRDSTLDSMFGPRSAGPFLRLKLSESEFRAEIERICRLMDFIASRVKEWGMHYPVFA